MTALSPHAPTLPSDPSKLWWMSARCIFFGAELRASITLWYMAGAVALPGDSTGQGVDGMAGLHPRVDPAPDYPSRIDVLDRAQLQRALPGVVRIDDGQSQFVRPSAVNSRLTRSSCTGGPDLRCRPFLLKLLDQPLVEQIRHAVRLPIDWPASSASSTGRRGGRRTGGWPGRLRRV